MENSISLIAGNTGYMVVLVAAILLILYCYYDIHLRDHLSENQADPRYKINIQVTVKEDQMKHLHVHVQRDCPTLHSGAWRYSPPIEKHHLAEEMSDFQIFVQNLVCVFEKQCEWGYEFAVLFLISQEDID